MDKFDLVLSSDEKAVYALRSIYKNYGYEQYRMSKFEEYDLYAKNKDFLVSESVITFTDTDGKLMALKPDVTLSIIKNNKDVKDDVKKVYYNEHVYRVSKGTRSFKEIMQVGLECLGKVDEYLITEVLFLAKKSLSVISSENVLDVSHLGIVKGVLNYLGISKKGCDKIFECLKEKNREGVILVCASEGLDEIKTDIAEKLVTIYGAPEKVIPELEKLSLSEEISSAIASLKRVIGALKTFGVNQNINIDFSVVSDLNYYNGFIFKGFVSGIPTAVLSGGEYDNLMVKMGRKDKAIGFAVYLDGLDKLSEPSNELDVDVAIEYNDASLDEVCTLVNKLVAGGEKVIAKSKLPATVTYKKLITLKKGE